MGRHSTPDTTATTRSATLDQALGLLVWDISKLISRNDGYDGLIPDDKLTPDDLLTLLPDLFRAAGFDPFAPGAEAPQIAPDSEFLKHTCNDGKGPFFGRLKPAECVRCAQREQERAAGIPAREAPARIQEARRQKELDEQSRRSWDHHVATRHHHGRCADGPVCTAGQC